MQKRRSILIVLFSLSLSLSLASASAQRAPLQITYSVLLAAPAAQQFHITTDIKNINQSQLDLSLPTWTPGWYTVENYARNILRFRVTDASGNVLPHTMSRKQTWRIDTHALKEIRVEYDYRATVLALNQAKVSTDFAFFSGTELFLQAEGHRNEPSTVRFSIPSGWKIMTSLKETSDPVVFTAANYDVLVDSPVELGNFDVTRFEVEGKPHYLVTNPAGSFSKDKADSFARLLAKVAAADSATFGGLPYEKYVYFYFFAPSESNASGALEHLNSFVAFAQPGGVAQPEQLINTAAHEFFHLWNVKRIRPAEMWPYDYSRENETPLLWVSEGFTSYYGPAALYRAGLMTPEAFIQRAADAAGGVENSEARKYISPAESSISTWLGYDNPTAFSISYYTQGQNLAGLLDLSIRQDTDGRSTLDDVMRALFNEYYKRDRGFTAEDMIQIMNRLTRKDYHDFYRRYVFGTEVPDYDRIFGYAGYTLNKRTQQLPAFGFTSRNTNAGFVIDQLDPRSAAGGAGLQNGDIVLKINGEPPQNVAFNSIAGKTINLTLNRSGREIELPVPIGVREVMNYSLVSVSQPSPQQLRIRESWLKR